MIKESGNKTLGGRIKIVRESNKLTQLQMSEELGIHETQLNKLENNKRKPSLKLLVDICTLYRVSSDYILFGVKDKD